MPRKRTLSLKRETLTELAARDLAAVNGAADSGPTCYTQCLTQCEECEVTGTLCTAISGSTCPQIRTLDPNCR